MTTLTTTLTGTCAGNQHLTFELSGDKSLTVSLILADLLLPVTAEDGAAFVRVIAQMARNGRTNAQARSLLLAGVTVTV